MIGVIAMLSNDQLERFNRDGYLLVEDVLDEADLRPVEEEYAAVLEAYAQRLAAAGESDVPGSELSFADRYTAMVRRHPECIDEFNISLPLMNRGIDPDTYHAHTGPAVLGLLTNTKILDVVESVIGSEIASSPVQQVRLKPPLARLSDESVAHSSVGNTSWHQDTVAVLPEALSTDQVTVWVAITDASEENGCLVSIPGSHREGAHRHVPGPIPREPTVPVDIIAGREGEPLPARRGSIVLFDKQNIHCSRPNLSDQLRWSFDIRYHPVGQRSGRPAFPGFVARSRSNPATELRDPVAWSRLWDDARERIITGECDGPVFQDWLSE